MNNRGILLLALLSLDRLISGEGAGRLRFHSLGQIGIKFVLDIWQAFWQSNSFAIARSFFFFSFFFFFFFLFF